MDPAGSAPSGAGAAMARRCATAAPTARACAADRPGHAGPHAAGDHRRGGRRPAARLRGRPGHGGRQRRDLQPPRPARGARARGHGFATRSDSEVVVHGYEQYGPDFVRRLNGIFALRSGTTDASGCSPRATRSASSPSTGARTARRRAGLRGRRAARRGPGRARARPGRAGPLPGLALRARPADALRRRQQAARRVACWWPRGRRAEGDQLPRGARATPLDGRRATSWRASWPSASPRPSGAR